MSTLTLAAGRPTLADRLFTRRLATDLILVAAGALLTSVFAQITIPLPFVPITGQTLAVLLVGSSLGATRGALSLALYAVLGMSGLPVFAPEANGSHLPGLQVIAGPTGGYIIGFILAAAITGWLAQLKWDHKILKGIASFAVGTVATFAVGLPWLAVWLGANKYPNDLQSVLVSGLYPFVIAGIVKAIIGAVVIRAIWAGVDRADSRAKPTGTAL